MSKRKLRNSGRSKAGFGTQEAAILSAAAINVAGSLAAAKLSADAARSSAREQAKSTTQAAQRQAQAIKDQSLAATEQQKEAQEFIKSENLENRELQKDNQKQLLIAMGQQNVNDRLEASKLVVKAGGKTRKLRNRGMQQSLLRGGNMPFTVTDGGTVLPVGVTPEGYDLYEIFGNDHEHYHKTRGGKYKSGVGIKFADGNVIEGEGDQRQKATNGGELMLVTPDDAFFISKHTIGGVNPKDLVEQGMHPLEAFNIQENQKDAMGINDDGTRKVKNGRRHLRFMIGGTPTIYDMDNWSGPKTGVDIIGDSAVGVVSTLSNEKRKLRAGGKTRPKAALGEWWRNLINDINNKLESNNNTSTNSSTSGPGTGARTNYYGQTGGNTSSSTSTTSGSTSGQKTNASSGVKTGNSTRSGGGFSNWISNNAELLGSGLTALGNFGGAWITSDANRKAARDIAAAQSEAAKIMSNAYNSLQTIDLNTVNREDYRAAHMMPALQAPISFADAQIAVADRARQRRLRNAGRYSASSAAAQERMNQADVQYQDVANKIYSTDQQQMQQIRQANAERVTNASEVNARLDTTANAQFAQDRLKLMEYNNDIINDRILGSAGALSEGAINSASTLAQGRISSNQAWATALGDSSLTFANTLSSMAKRRADLENVMLDSNLGGQVNWAARNGTIREKERMKAAIKNAINTENLSPEDKATYQYYLTLLS